MSEQQELLTEKRDGVMLITLNRPHVMNALGGSMGRDLLAAIEDASRDDDVHAVVITGTGRAFCAGAEISLGRDPTTGRSTLTRHERLDHRGGSARAVETFAASDVPIIAAVNGPAVGAGFGLAMCCDVRFMSESARIGPIFIKRGLAADYGASYWLPRVVGPAKAYEIFYEGEPMSATRALEVGVAQRVYPDDRLLEESMAFARRIASGPPLATTYIRRLVARSLDTPMHEFVETEWSWQSNLLRTEDAVEGFRAFTERRDPEFHGR